MYPFLFRFENYRAASDLEAERGARGKAEDLVTNLRGQLEGVRAAEEAARAAAQRTLALLEAEVSALKVQCTFPFCRVRQQCIV